MKTALFLSFLLAAPALGADAGHDHISGTVTCLEKSRL